jgi:hypothetical protein
LYKYFPDVGSILVAWHERQVSGHLEQLARIRDQAAGPGQRLEAVLRGYAVMTHDRPHGTDRRPPARHRHPGRAPPATLTSAVMAG